ncbi:hypothetical protein LI328DRAFT_130113 [Trichoderma asperelloides]|nr:hypothetical protein LI328DRAFT_130113 [Trichoderma asperelloides]
MMNHCARRTSQPRSPKTAPLWMPAAGHERCTSSCWATTKQKKCHQPKWHRRWLSGLLRQTRASLNLGTGHQARSGYKRREDCAVSHPSISGIRRTCTSTANAHLGLVPAGAWIRCHNLYRVLAQQPQSFLHVAVTGFSTTCSLFKHG